MIVDERRKEIKPEKEWEEIYKKLQDFFSSVEMEKDDIVKEPKAIERLDPFSEDYCKRYVENYIRRELQLPDLFWDLVTIDVNINEDPHGKRSAIIDLEVKTRGQILNGMAGFTILYNEGIIKRFMNRDDPAFYWLNISKLKNSGIFPYLYRYD